jgi:hypothetical protein
LPTTQRLRLADGVNLLGVHASPMSDDGPGITPEINDDELAALLAASDADVICGGHTHQPTDRRLSRQRVVNLGSVSNPITSDLRATYVVIDDDPHGHALVHRRVAYDHDQVLSRLRQSSHPEAGYLASFQLGNQVKDAADRPGAPTFAKLGAQICRPRAPSFCSEDRMGRGQQRAFRAPKRNAVDPALEGNFQRAAAPGVL